MPASRVPGTLALLGYGRDSFGAIVVVIGCKAFLSFRRGKEDRATAVCVSVCVFRTKLYVPDSGDSTSILFGTTAPSPRAARFGYYVITARNPSLALRSLAWPRTP